MNTPDDRCPICNSADVRDLVTIHQVPVHCNVLWPSQVAAVHAPRGDLQLGLCGECGHVFNRAFDPTCMEYTPAYENSLHFSPRFQQYAEALAAGLVVRHELHGKIVIEIGCGKGEFLALLCDLGGNRGVGFDPSYVPELSDGTVAKRFTVIRDFYSERYASYQTDFICCRHVLEHIASPREFLGTVRRAAGDRFDTMVFFEVPNVMYTLRDQGIWDIIYEHCSYFSASSLARLFIECGFKVGEVVEQYESQFLTVEARPRPVGADPSALPAFNLSEVLTSAAVFAEHYHAKVQVWTHRLSRMRQLGQQAIIWGAGSKGVTFLNTLSIHDEIKYVVDINPRKQGKYMAGTGQLIVAPEFLQSYRPDVVVVMNPIYQTEIQQLMQRLDLAPEIVCA